MQTVAMGVNGARAGAKASIDRINAMVQMVAAMGWWRSGACKGRLVQGSVRMVNQSTGDGQPVVVATTSTS